MAGRDDYAAPGATIQEQLSSSNYISAVYGYTSASILALKLDTSLLLSLLVVTTGETVALSYLGRGDRSYKYRLEPQSSARNHHRWCTSGNGPGLRPSAVAHIFNFL